MIIYLIFYGEKKKKKTFLFYPIDSNNFNKYSNIKINYLILNVIKNLNFFLLLLNHIQKKIKNKKI